MLPGVYGGGLRHSLIAIGVVASLAVPRVATAAPASKSAEAPAETSPAATAAPGDGESVVDRAQRLYREGEALYSAASYTAAIEKFTEVLGLISSGEAEFDADTRGLLLLNLAKAHERAYNVDPDLLHLRSAREVLTRIVDESATLGYSEQVVADAKEARSRVEAKLAEEDKAAPPEPTPAPTPPPPSPTEDKGPSPKLGKILMITGGAVAGVGLATSAIWIAGIVKVDKAEEEIPTHVLPMSEPQRIAAIEDGRKGTKLIVTGAVVSSVIVSAGLALIAVGLVKHLQAKRTACAPAIGPRMAALGCGVRF